MSSRFRIRAATPGDLEFVVDSWVESYRMSHFSGPIPMPLYREVMERCVRWILARPDVEVLVACKPDELPPDDVYGWLCVEHNVPTRVREWDPAQRLTVEVERPAPQPVVHYAYVKQIFREKRVASRLCQAAGVDTRAPLHHTHKTAIIAKLQGLQKLPGATFAPQLARYPKK